MMIRGIDMNEETNFKYSEDVVIKYLEKYIKGTYSQHYVGSSGIQAIDVWKSLNIDEESFRSNIIKYAMRYKYKDGTNLKDLVKILHYTILLIDRNHSDEIRSVLDTEKRT